MKRESRQLGDDVIKAVLFGLMSPTFKREGNHCGRAQNLCLSILFENQLRLPLLTQRSDCYVVATNQAEFTVFPFQVMKTFNRLVTVAIYVVARSSFVTPFTVLKNSVLQHSSLNPAVPSTLTKINAAADRWGGEYADEAQAAADLVRTAVRLCQQVQEELAIARGDTSLGTTITAPSSSSYAGTADVKVDGTPVTAADFAIQGYVSLRLQELFPDRFMGEEDATDLRTDPALLETSLGMAKTLLDNTELSDDDFLGAVDRGVEPPRSEENERVWILDPIDGTKGLITGKQYIVGLALTVNGRAVVAAMGNPAVQPEVMVAVKGHGLRYWPASEGEDGCIEMERKIPNNWHLQPYDFEKLSPAGGDGWTGGVSEEEGNIAGVHYPPYLLSRPMTVGSPLPFGPMNAPSEVCCGAQVKYFAVARGEVAGFIQFQSELKSWDHAPGVLCVEESGGSAKDADGNEIVFDDRSFRVKKGIVCCAAEANDEIRTRLMSCVQETEINVPV